MARAPANRATMRNVAFTRWDPLRDLLALHEQTRASGRHRRAGLDAAGRSLRNADRVRPDRGTARPRARSDRHSRRRQPHRDPRRARRRPGRDIPVRAVSTASSAATAASRARSRCRSRSTSNAITADLKDGILTVTIPKAARSRRAPHRRQLTSRDRHDPTPDAVRSCSSSPGSSPAWWSPGACARPPIRAPPSAPRADRAPRADQRAGADAGPPRRRRRSARRPGLHARRRPGGQGRREHLVAAGRPHAATRRSPTIRSSATSSATTSSSDRAIADR